MKSNLATLLLLTCLLVQPAFAVPETGPSPLAVSFMTQFYEVAPRDVKTSESRGQGSDMIVKAEADGHVCTFTAAPLPNAKYGWALASLNCGK